MKYKDLKMVCEKCGWLKPYDPVKHRVQRELEKMVNRYIEYSVIYWDCEVCETKNKTKVDL